MVWSVKNFVYRRFRKGYCAYEITTEEGLATYHEQCKRKAKMAVEGYWFCRQHARMIERSRQQAEEDRKLLQQLRSSESA